MPTTDVNARALYHYIATGIVLKHTFYRNLNDPTSAPDVSQYVDQRRIDEHHDVTVFEQDGGALNAEEHNDSADVDNVQHIEEIDVDGIWDDYKSTYEAFEEKLRDHSTDIAFAKCLQKYTKMLRNMTSSNCETLKRHLYGFGKSLKKRKNSHVIPCQPTAISRRKYKHRGRSVATYGRRVKDTALMSQMLVTDDDNDGNVYHSLPKQKHRSNKLAHSLKNSVDSNRQNAKKH